MKTLSIVIPVYNEQERLDKTFEALSELHISRGLKLEKVIFVNDGSTDKTKEILRSVTPSEECIHTHRRSNFAQNDKIIQLISYKKNKGKGYAVKQGMLASNSDYTLFCDADMSTHLKEIKKFMPFIRKNVPIIIGTRKNGGSTVVRHQPLYREILGRIFTLFSNVILNTWVTDFTCGFKAFSKEAKEVLFSQAKVEKWSFDAEVLFLGRIFGFTFVEVPVIWNDDRRSKVRLWKDLPKSFIDLFYIRLNYLVNLYQNKGLIGRKPAFSFLKTVRAFLF